MEAVTMFRALGRTFDTAEAAERHEAYAHALAKADAVLRTPIEDMADGWGNGGGYIQQDPNAIVRFMELVGEAFREFESAEIADRWESQPRGIVGRLLDDKNSIGASAYYRLMCIDPQYREWGQLYFALNPQPYPKPWPHVKEVI